MSKNIGRYVENTNKKSSFLWQICQFNHYGWHILLKFYWFLNSKSQNLLLACFLISPILDPKFPLMITKLRRTKESPYLVRRNCLLLVKGIPRYHCYFFNSQNVRFWHWWHLKIPYNMRVLSDEPRSFCNQVWLNNLTQDWMISMGLILPLID